MSFEDIIRANTGCSVIIAGSGSDAEHIGKIVDSLQDYAIPFQVRIISGHKQPIELLELIGHYNSIGGSLAYVAVAGGTDALSGILSYCSNNPVISCPPDGSNQSCLNNPAGSSNAFIAKPANVGRFIAQMYSAANPAFRDLRDYKRQTKNDELVGQDSEMQSRWSDAY